MPSILFFSSDALSTAMATTVSSLDESAFGQALDKFRSSLTADEEQDFQFTTVADLKVEMAKLQNKQLTEKRMRNLKRLASFVEKMEQFGKVVNVYLNASVFVAFVWVRCHLLISFRVGSYQ